MSNLHLPILVLISLVVPILVGVLNLKKTSTLIKISKATSLQNISISIVMLVLVFNNGLIESGFIGFEKLGFSLRIDQLSAIIFTMISIISFVVLKFSYNYLDGDERQGVFIKRLLVTIACIQLMVLSGNILLFLVTWILINLSFQKLLLFYPELKKAQIAGTKKNIISRLGEATFILAMFLVYREFGTGNLEEIFQQIKQLDTNTFSLQLEISAILLVATAALCSAQFPFHGWLVEVMESPTPVSALLHAGLLNAGPFLMIRFSYILDAVQIAPVVLFIIGFISALFGAIVFITQSSVKTSLAYSSIAHMGFTLMVSGLGIYSASLLHLVGHSFYKAHSFLSSGSIIDKVRTKQASTFERKGSVTRIIFGMLLGVFIYSLITVILKIDFKNDFQLFILGGIVLTSIIGLLINTLDSENSRNSIFKIIGASTLIIVVFFNLEALFRLLLGSQIPNLTAPTIFQKYLFAFALLVFFIAVLLQALTPIIKNNVLFRNLGIHLRNGLYVNILFNRLINTLDQKSYQNRV